MGKRLAPIFAVLAMLAPVAAFALGLGDITMKSALNQPLDAEIELLSVQKGDLDDLRVRLGSVEDFARVGADRAYFLTKIKFDIAKKPDGTPYVRLTTREPVTEPFLDFVVEARWPRGRILREFTVLVDPPVLSEEAPAPIQQAAVQPAAPAPAPARATRQAPIRARAELSPIRSRDGALSYGPVRPNDTLWVIANRMRPDESVTVNQMMLALVRDNPQAFYNGNVNQLKAGYVLRIEDPAAITAISPSQADAEVERQRAEWEARKSGRPLRQVAAATGAEAAAGTTTAAGPSAGQARLKLVAPGSEGAGSGTGDADVERLRQDLVLAAEALDANRQETEELKTRLAQMEEQLAAMQRLIMLKDDEMLALQKQLGGETEAAAGGEEATVSEEAPAAETTEPVEAGVEAEAEEAPAGEAAAPAEEARAPTPAVPVPTPPAPEPGLLEDPRLMYGGIGVLVLAIVGWIMARRRKMQEGFQESILNVGNDTAEASGSEMVQGAEGESSMVSDFAMSEMSDMSGIQTDATEVDPISEADVYLAYGRHQQAEDIIRAALENEPERNDLKLKLLEVFFAAKNTEAFETQAQALRDALGDETDPLWAKAVTMGTQLCPDNPLFGGTAQALQEEPEGASSAVEDDLLDFDFDLDSTDLGGDASKAGDDDFDAQMDAALGEAAGTTETTPATSAEVDASADNGLDFDVSTLDFNLDQASPETETEQEMATSSEEEMAIASDESGALDFDMESLDESASTTEVDEATVEVEVAEAEEGLEFPAEGEEIDLGVEEAADVENALEFESLEAEEVAAEAGESEFSVDLDASELDLGEDEAIEFDTAAAEEDEVLGLESGLEEVTEPQAEDELSLSGLDLEETGASEEASAEAVEAAGEAAEEATEAEEGESAAADEFDEELLGEDIFGEVDEIGTKLDLAKAYVDMGDGDGARSILDEVLEEGDDSQKEQAKALLEQLG